MELTLGPVLFEWKKEDLLGFYEEAAEMPVDTVYVGEVVCSKRRSLGLLDMERIGNMLKKAGKKPVMTTLAVISNEEELNFTREVCSSSFRHRGERRIGVEHGSSLEKRGLCRSAHKDL